MNTSPMPFSILSITAALCLSGCQTTTKSSGTAASQELPSVPGTWTRPANSKDVRVGWIETFKDPTLVKIVREAQENNKNVQAAAANLEKARALSAKAGAGLKPAVNLTAGGTARGPGKSSEAVPTIKQMNVGLQIQWEIDVWGRIRAGVDAAEAGAQAAEADYRFTQHSLAATTAKAYFMAISSRVSIRSANTTVSTLEEMLRIITAKKKNGAGTALDLAVAKADLASAREVLVGVKGSNRDALRALEVLLGRYPGAEITVRESLPNIPPSPPSGIPSQILERRPDVVAIERRVAAAFHSVDTVKAAQLPRLSLTSNIGGTSGSLSDILKPEKIAWQAAANLLQPLFDGGALKADEWAATADQKQVLAEYGRVALNAFSEVETSLDDGIVLGKRIVHLQEVLKQSDRAYRIAKLRHKEGESELLDVLTVHQRVISARSNLIDIHRLSLEQRVNLHLALGGSW